MGPSQLAALCRNPETRRRADVRRQLEIPFGGVIVDKRMVLNHRYLRRRGHAYSRAVEAVTLPRKARKASTPLGRLVDLGRAVIVTLGTLLPGPRRRTAACA